MSTHRRDILIGAGYGIALALLSSGLRAGTALAMDADMAADLPDVTAEDNPSFEIFYHLSRMVTCRDALDMDAARKMFAVFQDEPWGKEHISRSYTKIKTAIENDGPDITVPQLLQHGAFDDGETWFVGHLLTTWYLGIYYHEGRPTQRVLYEDALMFEVLRDATPVPYVGATGFGEWADLPEGGAR